MKFLWVWIFLIVAFSSITTCSIGDIKATAPDKWLTRAKDAGNPSQVAEFLETYKLELFKANRVEGSNTSVWRYAATKMEVYVRALDGLIERAKALAQQVPTETSYQMGLINLEKDLGDIEAASAAVWYVDIGYFLVVVSSISILLLILALLMVSDF